MAEAVDTEAREGAAQTEEVAPEIPAGQISLYGEFRFKVDGKGRVSLPTKFRKVLPKDLVITRDLDDECLYVFVKQDFDALVDSIIVSNLGKYESSSRRHNALMRQLLGRAGDVEVDGTGRIMLSGELRQAVGIDKDVVLVAGRGRFEIWDAKRYDEANAAFDLSSLMHD